VVITKKENVFERTGEHLARRSYNLACIQQAGVYKVNLLQYVIVFLMYHTRSSLPSRHHVTKHDTREINLLWSTYKQYSLAHHTLTKLCHMKEHTGLPQDSTRPILQLKTKTIRNLKITKKNSPNSRLSQVNLAWILIYHSLSLHVSCMKVAV